MYKKKQSNNIYFWNRVNSTINVEQNIKEGAHRRELTEKEKCILNDHYVLFNYLKINKKVRWVKIVWNVRKLIKFFFLNN
jgi:hypothetical protein